MVRGVTVVVSVLVGLDGQGRYPLIVESSGRPTLVLATLDAMRKWRFEPARLDGEPVEVYFKLTVRYHPGR